MRWIAVLVPVTLAVAGAPRAARPASTEPQLSDEEKAFCEAELDVVDRRKRLFEAQKLSAAEIARKNEPQVGALVECRDRFRAQQRRADEEKQDLEEAARRAGPNATEKERERAWREVRRERLASKSRSSLTAEERAELAAGTPEEISATHSALDTAHAQDSAFMRTVHSALACYHSDRKAELERQISSEQALVKLGSGDRQRLYALRSELRQSEEVLERSREEARRFPAGLERCTTPAVAVLAHCLAIGFQDKRTEPACESEEIQQYVRFVK